MNLVDRIHKVRLASVGNSIFLDFFLGRLAAFQCPSFVILHPAIESSKRVGREVDVGLEKWHRMLGSCWGRGECEQAVRLKVLFIEL
jgi:hypothetical protein